MGSQVRTPSIWAFGHDGLLRVRRLPAVCMVACRRGQRRRLLFISQVLPSHDPHHRKHSTRNQVRLILTERAGRLADPNLLQNNTRRRHANPTQDTSPLRLDPAAPRTRPITRSVWLCATARPPALVRMAVCRRWRCMTGCIVLSLSCLPLCPPACVPYCPVSYWAMTLSSQRRHA